MEAHRGTGRGGGSGSGSGKSYYSMTRVSGASYHSGWWNWKHLRQPNRVHLLEAHRLHLLSAHPRRVDRVLREQLLHERVDALVPNKGAPRLDGQLAFGAVEPVARGVGA